MLITQLRCENTVNPLGVELVPLRLSFFADNTAPFWQATVIDGEGNTCFSEKLSAGARSFLFTPEKTRTQYRWQVEGGGAASEWASFETGLAQNEWKGQFIGMPVSSDGVQLYRRLWQAKGKVARARAYLAAEGFAELWVNNNRINENLLEPANTDYTKRLLYQAFDITPYLQEGKNAFGLKLNKGWGRMAGFLLQIYVEYADGGTAELHSEPGAWVFTPSEIILATLYSGEQVNPAYEKPYWNLPTDEFETRLKPACFTLMSLWLPEKREDMPFIYDLNADKYYPACELPAPGGKLCATPHEPIRQTGEFKPVSFKKMENGVVIYDFGQNFSGVCRLKVEGPKGTRVVMEHSELLQEDGHLNMLYLKIAEPNYPYPMQTDGYILRGEGVEEYTPRFTYHGFRYVALHNLPCEPTLDTVTGLFIHSDIKERGCFDSGSDMINWLQSAIRYTELSNIYGILTDCPQRAERQGWLNDVTARCEGAVYNLDMQRMLTKWLDDIADTQDPVSGAIADTAPFRRGNYPADTVVTSYLLVPYFIYQHFGDIRPLKKHYKGLCGWTDYLLRNSKAGIGFYSFYGDWAGPIEGGFHKDSAVSFITPGEFMSSGFNYYNCQLMEEISAFIGEEEKASHYGKLKEEIGAEMVKTYWNAETANFATASQGANVFALHLGIVPAGQEARVVENVVADIRKNDNHLTTGNLATKYIIEVLTKYGRIDVAMELINQDTYPSWGYMRAMGATTIWERWEYATGYGMNSHSHPMYGAITSWFFRYLAGLSPVTPGFEKTLVRPYVPTGLPYANATLETAYGPLHSSWQQDSAGVTYTVKVPAGIQAQVELAGDASVVEGNALSLGSKEGRTLFTLTGNAVFTVKA